MSRTDQTSAPDPQLLFVGGQDTSRLLEVYVKRSLSLNDSQLNGRRPAREHGKWISLAERNAKIRRHSSDTSLHLPVDMGYSDNPVTHSEPQTGEKNSDPKKSTLRKKWMSFRDTSRRPSKLSKPSLVVKPAPSEYRPTDDNDTMPSDLESSTEKPRKKKPWSKKSKKSRPAASDDRPTEHQDIMPSDLESSTKEKPKKKKRGSKGKKSSVWKSIVDFFSRGDSDTDERDPSPERTVCPPPPKPFSEGEEVTLRRRKSSKKRRSQRIRSLKAEWSEATHRPLSIMGAIERVEPTDSYYEHVSDELKKIVTEVMDSPSDEHVVFPPDVPPTETDSQSLSTDELTDRLIALIKHEGDSMNAKMKESPSLSNFFQGLTYGSFQQLADQYVLSEIPADPTQDPVVAPELVKLAFTLDFTARMAGLSRQSPSHIMGHGKCYLQERFTYEAQPEVETQPEVDGQPDVEPTGPLMMRTAREESTASESTSSMENPTNMAGERPEETSLGTSPGEEGGEPEERGLGKKVDD